MQGRLKTTVLCFERSLACGLFIVYCLWNVYWLVQRRPPPSLFQALTGLPCPTTGLTRSLLCLAHGDFRQSLQWNALMAPILVLFALSLSWLARCLAARRPIRLHNSLLSVWAVLLAVAWACKLLGSASYW